MTETIIRHLSPDTMQSLAWTLLHFVWQGTALAALAAACMAVCRRTQVRYILGVGFLGLMLIAPVVTFSVLWYAPVSALQQLHAPVPASRQVDAGLAISSAAIPEASRSFDAFPWLVEAWLLGVAFFSLRTAGGFLLLARNRRKHAWRVATRILDLCRELQDQLDISRAIRFCECAWLQVPAVIGWFRPVVFLPASALTGLSEEQLRMVIAHELAHIRRFDAFVNVFQVFVETVLFYHPAVWWLNKRIRAEREHCCDETAVQVCGDAVEYARALTMMAEWHSAPAFALGANGGNLTDRVLRILGRNANAPRMRGIGVTASILCVTAAVFAGNALFGIAHPKIALASEFFRADPVPVAAPTPAPAPQGAPAPKPSAVHPRASESSASSYIDGMKSAGLGDLSIDELIALKTQDVTPEYVRAMREQGLDPTADNLIAMRVQDITPEYVREWHSAGLHPDLNQLVALKVQDANAAYYTELKSAGIDADVNRLIALKVQGVTPDYVREMKAAGLTLTPDLVVAMKVQEVSPAYVKAIHDLGLQPSANDLIAMRVQDITPEWIRGIQSLGLKPTISQLIALKVQDVTPDYIKALQSAGFKFDINDVISAKIQDVTPEFINQARQHGFKDLTLQKLIQLRQLGILDSKAEL